MKNTFNVLGVAGSTRQSSYSTRALKIALEHVKKHGAEVRLLELSRIVLPLYDPSAPASKEVERAAEAIAWADAFILASPDYHGSMSGALKNFLDHFYEEFAGKVFGYIVASHEKGLTGQETANTRLSSRLRMMARDLVIYGRLVRDQFMRDFGSNEPDTFAAHYRP